MKHLYYYKFLIELRKNSKRKKLKITKNNILSAKEIFLICLINKNNL